MLSVAQIKLIKSLQQKKFRESENLFVAETPKIVDDLLVSSNKPKTIYAVDSWKTAHPEALKNVELVHVSEKELERISGLKTPNQVLAILEIPKQQVFPKNIFEQLTLVLDTINDPGNLGTIIRIADWFGIPNIICSNDSVDVYNPKTVQSAMGSTGRVNVFYKNLPEFLSGVPANCPVYGTLLEGESLYETKLSSNGLIVVGNEANGISREVQKFITHKIHIPCYSTQQYHAESLNASVATSVVCAEFRRNFSKS